MDLLDEAIAAHGGMARWRAIERLEIGVSLTGPFYEAKSQPRGMRHVRMRIDPRRPVVDVSPFPSLGKVGRFAQDRVTIVSGDTTTEQDLPDARASFNGQLLTPWSDLQLLYFNAYAMWNYATVPFLLAQPGFELAQLPDHHEANERWRPLRARFPAGIPTHNPEQVYYFDDQGLLKRIDYVTEIAGGVAAHYCYDHATFGGIVFPTLRRVTRRDEHGAWPSLRTFILIRIDDVFVA